MAAVIFVLMAHELLKCIIRKLNVADFRCKHNGKHTLNVNIIFMYSSHILFLIKQTELLFFSFYSKIDFKIYRCTHMKYANKVNRYNDYI